MSKSAVTAVLVLLVLCVAGLGALGYSNWQLQQEIASLRTTSATAASTPAAPGPAATPAPTAPAPATGGSTPSPADPFASFFADDWDPFAEMQRMQAQMQQMMQQGGVQTFSLSSGQPDIALEESQEAYVVHITIPEGSNIELNTEVGEHQLTVIGKVSSEMAAGGANIVSSSQFTRAFPLSSAVDSLGMTTKTENNTIVITLPKVS